jgi:two-component system response regulator BaeR
MTAAPLRILVVEDEPKISKLLSDYLVAAGFVAETVSSGLLAVARVRQQPPALVLLDVLLPGRSGVDVCRDIRQFCDVPIIMVTAVTAEVERLRALDIGADDYVCKPFSPREVVARVRAVLRRRPLETTVVRRVGPLELDEAALSIALEGIRLDLTVSEYKILRRLMVQAGRLVSRARLISDLHGPDADTMDRAIDTHIKNIRKKMARWRPEAQFIRSVYGEGYELDPLG